MSYPIADNFKRRPEMKPAAEMIGKNGNVYNLMAICRQALRKYPNAFNELRDRVFEASSYEEALTIMSEYVEIE